MSFYGWKRYVPVAQRRKKAERAAAEASKAGSALSPVRSSRGAIARTFWGRAWCDNLERYSDFANRLPRGRAYLRSGSVIDLKIHKRRSARQGNGVASLRCQRRRRYRSPEAVAVHQRRLRGLDRFAGRASPRPTFQGGDGTNLQAEHRPLPCAEGDSIQLQLSGLGFHVQARRGRAVWCGHSPRQPT